MIVLYADQFHRAGGIETYLHALALKLHAERLPCRIMVSGDGTSPLLDELRQLGIPVYVQPRIPGDRWNVRRRAMMCRLWLALRPGDWVYCVRQPDFDLYLPLVRLVHSRGARLAASWMVAPVFLPPPPRRRDKVRQAIVETDAVISVSKCTVPQFREVYDYPGRVHVVPYHNVEHFPAPVPLPPSRPWKVGYLGRIDIRQKNLDGLLVAMRHLVRRRQDVELHLYGAGGDERALQELVEASGPSRHIVLHGGYDHRTDLGRIVGECHFFVYTSRYEGGPCLSLLELLQAGRYCVTSPVGGIPDLYEGHPEAGIMVDPTDPEAIAAAFADVIERLEADDIDAHAVRRRYAGAFDNAAAHRAWTTALSGETSNELR